MGKFPQFNLLLFCQATLGAERHKKMFLSAVTAVDTVVGDGHDKTTVID